MRCQPVISCLEVRDSHSFFVYQYFLTVNKISAQEQLTQETNTTWTPGTKQAQMQANTENKANTNATRALRTTRSLYDALQPIVKAKNYTH